MSTFDVGPVADVLISEVGGAGRWAQFSPTQTYVENFFGTPPDQPYVITLRSVSSAGILGALETPNWIIKQSVNWAFELAAASDLEYPADKATRPIAILLRTGGGNNSGAGRFLYTLLMPGAAGYDLVAAYLAANAETPANQLRRLQCTTVDLLAVWGACPLFRHWP